MAYGHITTHDNSREWSQRRLMFECGSHPPLFLERAADAARVAMVYVENPPEPHRTVDAPADYDVSEGGDAD